MEDKKAYLVQLDYEETEDIQLLICSGLKELATGCKAAVKEFSACQGREHVDHLVDIHLTSISGRVCNNIRIGQINWYSSSLCSWSTNNPSPPLIFDFSFFSNSSPCGGSNPARP